MGGKMNKKPALLAGSFLIIAAVSPMLAGAAEMDADAVQALMKKSNCSKCHAVDKKKDGPPYKETAKKYKEKYKDQAEAEQKLYTHLTTNPKVKVDDKEEEHTSLKTKNEAEIRSVIKWILTR